MNTNNTRLIIESIRHASKFMKRDYFELEGMQGSRSAESFAIRSQNNLKQKICDELERYYKVSFKNIDSDECVAVVTFDGMNNLRRALEFFTINVSLVKNKEVIDVVVALPLLDMFYYSEHGRGNWRDSYFGLVRLQSSNISEIEDALFCSDVSSFKHINNISSNIRIFDSSCYLLTLLISGKIDAFVVNKDSINFPGMRFLLNEAKCDYEKIGDVLIASNFRLYDKLISLLK